MAAEITKHAEENWDAIVADPDRDETYESVAQFGDENEAPDLAAWARERAAKGGQDVTPVEAEPDTAKSERSDK